MSHTIPSSWPLRALQEFATGELMSSESVKSIPQAAQRTWSRRGARVAGLYYPADGWKTSSSTYTSTDSGTADEDLTTWTGLLRLGRPHRTGTALLDGLELQVFGELLDVRARVYAVDTGTQLLELEALGGSGWQWAGDDGVIAEDDTKVGGVGANALRLCRVELEARSRTGGTNATLRCWSLDHWQGMANDQIPRGY